MPVQYSIMESNPDIKNGPGSVEFHIVPEEIAITHDRGCYALFNDDGEKVSNWCLLGRKVSPEKPSTRASVKDSIQQTVVVGDYVGYNNSGGTSPISVGKITGFTNKQVRVLSMSTRHVGSSRLMYESSVIKLPESLWTGTL